MSEGERNWLAEIANLFAALCMAQAVAVLRPFRYML